MTETNKPLPTGRPKADSGPPKVAQTKAKEVGGAGPPKAEPKQPKPENPAKTNVRPSKIQGDVAVQVDRSRRVEAMVRANQERKARAAEMERRERERLDFEPDQDRIYFLRCPREEDHIAVFFTGVPRGVMPDERSIDATYSPAGQPLHGPLLCQACLEEGNRDPITFQQRLVSFMTKDEFDDLTEGIPSYFDRRDRERREAEARERAVMPEITGLRTQEFDVAASAHALRGKSPQVDAALTREEFARQADEKGRLANVMESRGDIQAANRLREEQRELFKRADAALWRPSDYPVEVHPKGPIVEVGGGN
jgi:hypothetical protein